MVSVTEQRRRRWMVTKDPALVRQRYESGMTVSLVARQHGVSTSNLANWGKFYRDELLTAVRLCWGNFKLYGWLDRQGSGHARLSPIASS